MKRDEGTARAVGPPTTEHKNMLLHYTKDPAVGRVAGRVVDGELWKKLTPAVSQVDLTPQLRLQDEEVAVKVSPRNGRQCELSLANDGVQLSRRPLACDWKDASAAGLAAEIDAIKAVKELTGCVEAVAFNTTWRSSERDNRDSSKGPEEIKTWSSAVSRVHADFTPQSAKQKIEEMVNDGRVPKSFAADKALGRRAVVNVWRAFGKGECVKDFPLAFLHPKSIDADIFPYYMAHGKVAGVNASIAHSPQHEWIYFPDMTPEEVVLFYNFDDRSDAVAPCGTFHAALELEGRDPRPPRLSVEVRILARW